MLYGFIGCFAHSHVTNEYFAKQMKFLTNTYDMNFSSWIRQHTYIDPSSDLGMCANQLSNCLASSLLLLVFILKWKKKVLCIISYMYLLEFILKILVHGCQCTICLRNYRKIKRSCVVCPNTIMDSVQHGSIYILLWSCEATLKTTLSKVRWIKATENPFISFLMHKMT